MEEFGSARFEMIEKFRWMRWFRFFFTLFLFLVYFFIQKMNVFYFPLIPFSILCFAEGVLNQPYPFITKRVKDLNFLAYLHMILDLVLISAIIHYLGGIEFYFFSVLYTLIIINAGILLSKEACYHAAFLSSSAFSSIVALEYFNVIPKIVTFNLNLDGLHQFGIVSANILFFYVIAALSGYSTNLLKEKSQKLEKERVYSEKILSTMADGLMVLELDGLIKDMNQAAEELLGAQRQSVVGHRMFRDIFKEGSAKDVERALKELKAEGVLRNFSAELSRKDGKEVYVKVNASMLKGSAGGADGIVAVLHDSTKEREIDRVKNDFISNITHELLTPLTSMGGFLSILKEGRAGELTDEQKEHLLVIEKQARHLGALIESMLDFSRMETGRMELKEETASVEVVIGRILSDAALSANEKGLLLDIDMKEGLPKLFIDKKKIGRAFLNIFGNAIKFTPRGGRIRVSVCQNDGFIEVSVADTGIGIAKENLERIFEKFFQIDSSLTRIAGGAGVGLSIAKEIIEAHGGRLWAQSEGLGRGSTFIFTLPAA